MATAHANDSDSSDEGEFFANTDGFGIEPYRFEPEYAEGEMSSSGEDSEDEEDEETQPEVEPNRLGNSDWCDCGHCEPMPSAKESCCCKELDVLEDKRTGEGDQCITGHEEFQAITHRTVVENTLLLLHHIKNNPVDITRHSGLRWASYRQWTAWVHGRLGWRVRVPIPACVVCYIRRQFPKEPEEEHVGFKDFESDPDQ